MTERAVYGQTCDYLTAYELLPELQSAYRKRYGTETALLNVQNDIYSEYGSSVDHHVLLSRLETTFSMTGRALT